MDTHKENKSYACTSCGKTFKQVKLHTIKLKLAQVHEWRGNLTVWLFLFNLCPYVTFKDSGKLVINCGDVIKISKCDLSIL